ncbi:MAG: exodeoxyribonuclease VII large subunit [Patescibacteria group bacterium]
MLAQSDLPEPVIFSPSDFVASTNQVLEYATGHIVIEAELSEYRVRKNKWLYFKLKDDHAVVDCFGTVYMTPGPLEDGMMLRVSGTARLHPRYGFSFQVSSITPIGEGSLKKSQDLLRVELEKQGLFDESKKRALPSYPRDIAVVASAESAALVDFLKIAEARWPDIQVTIYDTLVQGDSAPDALVSALNKANQASHDVLIVTRGGGSTEDLSAFSSEQVVRAVAASKTPTMVAIGHEIDESLAELAADVRASTPSNAAELLLPDCNETRRELLQISSSLQNSLDNYTDRVTDYITSKTEEMKASVDRCLTRHDLGVKQLGALLASVDPYRKLQGGFSYLTKDGVKITSVNDVASGDTVELRLNDGRLIATIHDKERRA